MVTTLWLCLALVLAPLPFGSVTIGPSTLLAIACFVALLLALGCPEIPPRGAPVYRLAAVVVAVALFGLAVEVLLDAVALRALGFLAPGPRPDLAQWPDPGWVLCRESCA